MKPLHKLNPGEKAFIVDIQNTKLCHSFFDLGIFPGDLVEMKENRSDNNLLLVNINNHLYKIFRPAAETIITGVVNFQVDLN